MLLNQPGKPLVSIGMPVYNCEQTVAAAISSIRHQSFTDWELIIVDDGSTDSTRRIVESYSDNRIRLVRGNQNLGLPTRLNQAVAISHGKYFARMDGDDVSYPNRLRSQLVYIESHPGIDVLGGSILIFDRRCQATGLRRGRQHHDEICGNPISGFSLPHVTWMGLTGWFSRNPYRADATFAQDRELLLRTHRSSCFAALPEVLVGVRETGVTLKKLLPSRYQYGMALFREAIRQRDIFLLAGCLGEGFKAGLDVLATSTGLGYRILRHRLPTVGDAEREEWKHVCQSIKQEVPDFGLVRSDANVNRPFWQSSNA
jgi:glycosyltransferase involved in cell wall biosynthesis